jgi:hypothetical protein
VTAALRERRFVLPPFVGVSVLLCKPLPQIDPLTAHANVSLPLILAAQFVA